jgi:adenylate cyclase
MKRHTKWRLESAARVAVACIAVSYVYEAIDNGAVSFAGLYVGLGVAMPLVLLEESGFDRRMRRLPFSVALIARALTYLVALATAFLTAAFVNGLIRGQTLAEFRDFVLGVELRRQMAAGFALYLVIVFVRQLDRLLGPGVLGRYLSGRYHRPRTESRIFMFMDLRGSTSLAERLGPQDYYALVNECFRDLATPVLDSSGEIYEYVGDEVVLTWTEEQGVREANCVRVFFDFADRIASKRQAYLDRFGVVPEFKAGLHCGEVVTAEIGDLKRSLVFNGDVLNTGARIEGQCNPLGKRLLASRDLVERLRLPAEWTTEDMGEVELRGKAAPMRLVAFA